MCCQTCLCAQYPLPILLFPPLQMGHDPYAHIVIASSTFSHVACASVLGCLVSLPAVVSHMAIFSRIAPHLPSGVHSVSLLFSWLLSAVISCMSIFYCFFQAFRIIKSFGHLRCYISNVFEDTKNDDVWQHYGHKGAARASE